VPASNSLGAVLRRSGSRRSANPNAEERESSYYRRLGGNGTHRLLSIWSISTGVLFCLCAAWSFATPIGAAQDEPAQLVKAASVVRGEIVGPTPSKKSETHLPVWDRAYLQICAAYSSADRCNRPVLG
jgi:hypothetical protein